VIDGILEHSPADQVRRPNVPPESPRHGLSHLQFEALLSAARVSANPNDCALVAMLGLLGLLGLRIFEATGADIDDLGASPPKWPPAPEPQAAAQYTLVCRWQGVSCREDYECKPERFLAITTSLINSTGSPSERTHIIPGRPDGRRTRRALYARGPRWSWTSLRRRW
jgi:hypothetical protein